MDFQLYVIDCLCIYICIIMYIYVYLNLWMDQKPSRVHGYPSYRIYDIYILHMTSYPPIVIGYLLYYINTKSHLHVYLTNHHVDILAVCALLEAGLVQNESCILWNHVVYLYKSSSATICQHEHWCTVS